MKIKFYLMGLLATVFLVTTVIGPVVSYARTMVEAEANSSSAVETTTSVVPNSLNATLRQQIADLMKRVAELQTKLTNLISTGSPVPVKDSETNTGDDEAMSPENEARIAINNAGAAIKELRSAISNLSDRTKALEARKAVAASVKQLSLARRAFNATKYEEAYRFAMEAKKIAEAGLAALNTRQAPIVCSLELIMCADGSMGTQTGPECRATCPVSAPAPVQPPMCTMDAKMCPDGSSVGRTGPKCEFYCPSTKSDESVKTQ